MERKFTFTAGEYYHVYSRGVDRRLIFLDDVDREYFQKLLFLCNSTERFAIGSLPTGVSAYDVVRPDTLVDIGAYAEMPNHIHLLLHEKRDTGISKFLAKLLTAFAKYFNAKAERTGVLFERPFRAKHVEEDAYMHYLHGYIHINPVKLIEPQWKENGIRNKDAAKDFLEKYRFSSYIDFVGANRKEKTILNREVFPDYFTKPASFDQFIRELLDNQ